VTLDNLRKKVATATDKVINLTLESSQEITEAIKEYKEAVESLKAFGLTVGKIHVAASPLPEISTTIKGSFNDLDEKRLSELLEAKKDQKLLTAILSALLMVTKLREVVDLAGLRNIVIQISLGIPPRIIVDIE
jgi:hypothetical protein